MNLQLGKFDLKNITQIIFFITIIISNDDGAVDYSIKRGKLSGDNKLYWYEGETLNGHK